MTEVDGEQCTWHHHVDFQPGAGRRDIGRVQFYGDRIVETGIKADHLEVRHRLPGSRGGTAAIELVMEASERPVHPAWLLVASDCFMYVRDRRAVDSTAPSRARLLLQVDVEISSGYRPPWPWPWRIEHSTLPFREGVTSSGRVRAGAWATSSPWRTATHGTRCYSTITWARCCEAAAHAARASHARQPP